MDKLIELVKERNSEDNIINQTISKMVEDLQARNPGKTAEQLKANIYSFL